MGLLFFTIWNGDVLSMNNKKKNVIFSVSFVCIATLLVLCSNFFLGKKENIIKSGEQNKKKIAETEKK